MAWSESRDAAHRARFARDTGATRNSAWPPGREAYHPVAGRVVVIGVPHRDSSDRSGWKVPALVLASMERVEFDTRELDRGSVRAPEVVDVWDQGARMVVRHDGMIWEKHPLGARCRREWRVKR